MDIKNFILSYYKNSDKKFHIHKLENTYEAKKPHTHEYFQIYYIAKGSLVHYIEDEHSHLTHGDMFIIPPGAVHRIEPSDSAVFYSLSFMPDFLDETNRNNKLVIQFLKSLESEKNKSIRPRLAGDPGELLYIENIMEHILKEFNEKPVGYGETVYAYTVLLLTILARKYFEKNRHSVYAHFENSREFVLYCISYIENNFTDDISLSEIAKKGAMSKSSFCAMFSEITGQSFNGYLNMCRIKKATEYIKKGYKITAIYGLCGYNDFSTFYRNFIKIMGMSPKDYKRQNIA